MLHQEKEIAVRVVMERRNIEDKAAIYVSSVIEPFFGGRLLIVRGELSGGESFEDFIRFHDYTHTLYRDAEDLARAVGHLSNAPRGNVVERLTREVLSVGGIAGGIALMLIGTICLIAFQSSRAGVPIQIPDALNSAMSITLGFYFGNRIAKHDPPNPGVSA